jgi:ribosome-associated translation inhibitor RaiA
MTQTVTTRNVTLSAHSKRVLNSVTEHLETFFRSVLRVEWALSTSGHSVEVHLHVHARSGHYRAHCRVDQVSEGIRLAADRVERQRRRKKAIGLRKKRQPTLSPAARPARTSKRGKNVESVSQDWED